MAIIRINERTVVQKVKTFILGTEKPNWMTRISVLVGLFISLYFLIWQFFIFISVLFVERLKNPDLIKDTFSRIGGKYNFNIKYASYNWNTMDVILYHSIGTITLLILSTIGLIIIYRRKKLGYITYLLSNGLIILFTILFLGLDYLKEQIGFIDKIIFIVITVYFLTGMFILKRTAEKELEETISE